MISVSLCGQTETRSAALRSQTEGMLAQLQAEGERLQTENQTLRQRLNSALRKTRELEQTVVKVRSGWQCGRAGTTPQVAFTSSCCICSARHADHAARRVHPLRRLRPSRRLHP